MTHDDAKSPALDLATVSLKLLEPSLQIQVRFLYLERRSLVASVARSKSLTLASKSSISMALAAWVSTLSAARTRVDGGVAGSTITLSNVVAAAVEACCKRAIDCPYAPRRAARYAASKSGPFSQRNSVLAGVLQARAASSTLRLEHKATIASSWLASQF